MDAFLATMQQVLDYLHTIKITDLIDIAIISYLFYRIILFAKETRAGQVLRGIGLVIFLLWIANVFNLHILAYILSKAVELGFLAVVVVFQPEIRHLIDQLGSSRWRSFNPFARTQQVSAIENAIAQTVLACTEMSNSRTGVLIVFEREMALDDVARTGTIVDARVSSELLKNIFFVKAAMHDGAVIMRDGRLLAGGCMLPLSKNVNLSRDLGMRHRAGIGISENSDAVVVIVSEETGTISVAIGGLLKRHLMPETLEKLLINELIPQEPEQQDNRFRARLLKLLGTGKGDSDDEK